MVCVYIYFDYFFQADDGIRDLYVTGVQTCALPISTMVVGVVISTAYASGAVLTAVWGYLRSEEHTSELQSRRDLVCRLLLEKKKQNTPRNHQANPSAASGASRSLVPLSGIAACGLR